jgi:histone H3/H4
MRPLRLSDLYLSGEDVLAAPSWAYQRHGYPYEPRRVLWRGVLRTLQSRADARHAQVLAKHRAFLRDVKAGKPDAVAKAEFRMQIPARFRSDDGPPQRPVVRAGKGTGRRWPRWSSCCAYCTTEFVGLPAVRYCTNACALAAKAKRATAQRKPRRVAHDPKPCQYCGESFTPTRSDARFCGGACRVAAHRASIRA